MKQKRILRVVVASPGDVQAERDTLPAVIDELNRGIAAERNLLLELLRWETDAYPGFHPDGPQGLIDPVLKIKDCDILIGIFWRRFGPPTKDAQSGTEHEILSACAAWQKNRRPWIMVYFNQRRRTKKSKVEAAQWNQVLNFKRRFPKEGMWWEYTGEAQFEGLVRRHLTQYILRQHPLGDASAASLKVEGAPSIPAGAKGKGRVSGLVSGVKKYASRLGLRREVLKYLDDLAGRAAELPAYYPDYLRASETGKTRFDDIRQMVQVVEDRSAFEHWLAAERERIRAAGQDLGQMAYSPMRARPEGEGGAEPTPDGPAPPPQTLWDESAGERFKRAVILGDPGFGKTWLLFYEARRLASDAARLLRGREISLAKLTLPIFARLPELNLSDDPLEDSLVHLVGSAHSDAFRHFVRRKLESDRCVILLDAWDEVAVEHPDPGQPIVYRPNRRQKLGERLKTFAHQFPLPRLLITSRIVGYDPTHLSIPDMQELELLAFNSPQTEAFVSVWFGEDTQAAERCLTILRQTPQLRGLGRIPLMLTLLCRTYVECKERRCDFPTHRVELYDRCLRGLLCDWKEEKEQRDIGNARVEAVLELLRAVSYALFAEGHEQFSESDLRKQVIKWQAGLKYNHELGKYDPTSIIDKLKRDGILITAGEHRHAPLLFLHRTFHEYLTGRALAQIVDEQPEGWQAEIELRGKKIPAHHLVDRKAWDPRWWEVITLLSGLLRDPAPLLNILADENRDDLFRHRLALATWCLPEVNSERRAQVTELADEITTTAFSLWWHHQMTNTARVVLALTRALPALAQVNARVNGTTLLERICQHLTSANAEERTAAAVAVREMGGAAAKPEVFDALARLLGRDTEDAVDAVRKLGSAAGASPSILGKLVQLFAETLQDPEGDELSYSMARHVVGKLLAEFMLNRDTGAAATPIIFDRLTETLQGDTDSSVWTTLTLAVSEVGNVRASVVWQDDLDDDSGQELSSRERLSRLVEGLQPGGRYAANKAAEGEGTKEATSIPFNDLTRITLDGLATTLQNPAWYWRSIAIRAVCKNYKAAATPAVLDQLARILQDPASGTAVTPFAFDRLDYMLGEANWATSNWQHLAVVLRTGNDLVPILKAWSVAVIAVSACDSETAAQFHDLDRLAQMMQDPYDEVRRTIHSLLSQLSQNTALFERSAAALAVSLFGSAAATQPFLDQLARMLKDSDDYDVWSAAVVVISHLGSGAATEPILDQLTLMLQHQDWLERFAAVIMMTGIGSAAGTLPVLDQLSQMLQNPNWLERSAALLAVAVLGGATTKRPEIIDQVARLLQDPIFEVRFEAALAIGNIGGGATPNVIDQLTRMLEDPIYQMRHAASWSLGAMMQSGVHFFVAGDGIKFKRVAELSAV